MHYVCFHYEFEHDLSSPDTDPDEKLLTDWPDGPPANWENQSLPDYAGSDACSDRVRVAVRLGGQLLGRQ